MRTCSMRLRISSTELFDAASNSCMLSDRPSLKARHDSHSLHASAPRVQAVDRFGEDACAGGLAHSARPAKEVGVRQLPALDGVLERRGDVALPDDRTEGRGAVFACADDKFTHDGAKIRKSGANRK